MSKPQNSVKKALPSASSPSKLKWVMSRPGFDGDLEARIASWQKGMLPTDGQTEEVPG
jgi:hypothetical protein